MTRSIPVIVEDDGDDVIWALTTAFTLWSSGDCDGATRWVGRAADSAVDEGRHERARELLAAETALAARKTAPEQMTSTGVRRKRPHVEPAPPSAPPSARVSRVEVAAPEAKLVVWHEPSLGSLDEDDPHGESPFPLLKAPTDRPSKPRARKATLPGLGLPPGSSQRPLPEWIPESRIVGGYFVLGALGSGSAGDVLVVTSADRVADPECPRFALKAADFEMVSRIGIDYEQATGLFRQEAAALLALPEHPNLARLISYESRPCPRPFLLMELVEGVACDELIDSGSLDMRRALGLVDGILAGLEAMHSVGVGHLDLKPGNVVVRGGVTPVLVDFGLSGRDLREWFSTPGYGAPEVWGGKTRAPGACPLAADVYSAACLVYELLTGQMLFDGPDPGARISAQLSTDLPEPIESLAKSGWIGLASALGSCLHRDPTTRPTSQALRQRLRALRPILLRASWPLAAPDGAGGGAAGRSGLQAAGSGPFQVDRSAVG